MRKIILSWVVYCTFASPAFGAGSGFTWGHFLFGWLEMPLAQAGIDPFPVIDMMMIAMIIIAVAFVVGAPFRKVQMLEPSGEANRNHVVESFVGGILNFLGGIIKHGVGARGVMPLLGTYAIFIAVMNLFGLIPGFNPPTDQFNITLAFGLIIFIATHYLGFKIHGGAYIKQFIGPLPALAPLMFPIELISHCVRPMSLAIRLFGNMTGDHKVLLIFTSIFPFLLPVPFMGLGTLVSILQAFVFVLLSAIYFEGAMGEAH